MFIADVLQEGKRLIDHPFMGSLAHLPLDLYVHLEIGRFYAESAPHRRRIPKRGGPTLMT